MRKEMFINSGFGETRAAIVENGRLVELYTERETHQRVAGNIYKGRVENVLPGMQAAFVNIGLERNAFLYVDDALSYKGDIERDEEPDEAAKSRQRRSIREILKEGQEIVVQVAKEPIGSKGARIVTNLSIPGRYLVLMPTVDYIGISRRIADEGERERLKALAKAARPKGMGLIVRTAAEGKDDKDIEGDARFLARVWDRLQHKAQKVAAPAVLYKDYDLVYRLVRDVFNAEFDRLYVDSRAEYTKVIDLLDSLTPHLKSRVHYYDGRLPLFEANGIEQEIEKALERKVWLECGGYLVIDHTEALTSIDVNTGRYIGTTNLADTVRKTNLDAAVEIACQMRLRDIGGIIIVDFIDMESKDDQEQVLLRLEEETRKDKTKTHILGFTHLGLVEITRKKVREGLHAQLQRACPYCDGSGRVLSEESVAFATEREIKKMASEDDVDAFLIALHPSVAAQVIGTGGANLRRLEQETEKSIYIRGSLELHLEEMQVLAAGPKAVVEERALPVKEGQVLDVQVQEAHVTNPKDGIARVEGYVLDIEGAGRHVGKRLKVEITKVFRTYAKGRMVPL